MRILLIFMTVAVTGCSVQRNNPGFVYPDLHASVTTTWPELQSTDQLAQKNTALVGDTISPQNALARRIARLRRKAARLSAYRF
mgnify:FL=1